jgi:hypothetical protein
MEGIRVALLVGQRARKPIYVPNVSAFPSVPRELAVRAIEAGVDLRLASKGEADIGSLVTRARWGHFAELPQLNTTRFTKRERRARKGVVAEKGKVVASA